MAENPKPETRVPLYLDKAITAKWQDGRCYIHVDSAKLSQVLSDAESFATGVLRAGGIASLGYQGQEIVKVEPNG